MKKLSLIFIILISILSCTKSEKKIKTGAKKPAPVIVEFGFKLNDYDVVQDTIVSGDTFGSILEQQNIGENKVHEIVAKVKDSFDVRKIRIGKPYTLLRSKDNSKKNAGLYLPA